jgi:hypothetical protein
MQALRHILAVVFTIMAVGAVVLVAVPALLSSKSTVAVAVGLFLMLFTIIGGIYSLVHLLVIKPIAAATTKCSYCGHTSTDKADFVTFEGQTACLSSDCRTTISAYMAARTKL